MHQIGNTNPYDAPVLLDLEDEELASRTDATLLITAANGGGETVARRIHGASLRADFPFLRVSAGGFPIDPVMLRVTCARLLDTASGGSVFITDIEDLPPIVQDLLVELLGNLQFARAPSDAVRVMTGTAVSLLDRIAAGMFSERLFYRLNLIHLVVPDDAPRRAAHASMANV
jgi:DNA-binding NtrC family response regulator